MSVQVTIKRNTYKKVEEELPFNLPTETTYLFMYGARISIRVIPMWTTWLKEKGKEEEIWCLHITVIHGFPDSRMETHKIQVSQIATILATGEGNIIARILSLIDNPDSENIRTVERFQEDFDSVLKEFKGETI